MYNIHATEGLVLGKRGAGEAHSVLSLLTREHGLVRAMARSARLERSKLRYGLEPLTFARYSLVRGKHEWRLSGVERIVSVHASAPERAALGRVSTLLLRLMPGEEPNPALFDDIKSGFLFLAGREAAPAPMAVEAVLVLRALAHLGYLPKTDALSPFVDDAFTVELSARALAERSMLVRAINESLRASGL